MTVVMFNFNGVFVLIGIQIYVQYFFRRVVLDFTLNRLTFMCVKYN